MTTLSPFWDQNYKTSNSVDNFKVTEQLNPNQLTRGQPYGDTSPNELGEYSLHNISRNFIKSSLALGPIPM